MQYTEQLSLRVSEDTRKKLEQRAKREQRSLTQMARVILERALRQEKTR